MGEGDSYQGGDSEEEFSDAPPAKKKKSSAKKKVKKAKKEKKKSKYTDDSDEDDIVAEVSEDDTAPATWRPGGPVVESAKAAAPSKKYVYKDASDQDFTDDGEIDDAADSDFDAGAKAPPKKRGSPKKTPAKKSPAKKGKKKTPAKKGKKAATNGTTPRASGRASAKIKYTEEDEDDDEEDEEDFEDEVPLKARKVAKQAKGRSAAVAKEKEPEIPPVAEMVPTAIRALRDNPRKGSSLSAIKGFMAEEWGINVQTYAPKIKKYLLRAVESGEVVQTKGKGASGRFTVPGLKARKKKSRTTKRLSKKFDEDEVEYEPGKSARDEAREQTEMELAERRARLEEEAARKLAEKEMKPKKPRPTPKTDWVVSCIKGMKIAQEKTWYQVIFLYLVPSPF